MKVFTTGFLIALIVFSFLQNWMVFAIVSLVVFSYVSTTVILIPIAILLDGYFGNFSSIPYISLFAVGWFVLTEYARPRMISIVQ